MNFWMAFWTWTIVISISIYTCVAVAVVIGGFGDILSMFKSLKKEHRGLKKE